jgi:hypothetical protein
LGSFSKLFGMPRGLVVNKSQRMTFAFFAMGIGLGGCSKSPEQQKVGEKQAARLEAISKAKNEVALTLKDPSSVQWRTVVFYDFGENEIGEKKGSEPLIA